MISFVSKLLFGRKLHSSKSSVRNQKRGVRRAALRVGTLEDRTLLSAGSFLQGTAFIDLHHDAILHPDDPYLSGATVALFQGATTSGTPLATTTTNSNGAYLFSDTNVPNSYGSPGLNPGVYTLVETPPPGLVSTGTEVLSQLNPASSVAGTTNAIQVTLVDPSSLYLGFNSTQFFSRHAWDYLQEKFFGTTTKQTAGQLPIDVFGSLTPVQTFGPAGVTNGSTKVTLSNSSGLAVGQFVKVTDGTTTLYSTIRSISANNTLTLTDKWTGSTGNAATVGLLGSVNTPFLTLCWDLQEFLDDGTNIFQVIPTSGQGTPTNAGEVAYLYNHYGTVDITNAAADNAVLSQATAPPPNLPTGTIAEAVGLQVAIWELEYGTNFNSLEVLKRNGSTDPAVLAQELSDVNTWASFYKQDAMGKNEVATFLQVVVGAIQGGEQGMLATGSYDFANLGQPLISTSQQPATATVGSSIADQATVTGGVNPTGTVTFNLYDNPNGTGTPLFTDTETLVGGVATSASFTSTATGTDYWVATYNGDNNNNAVTSGLALEPVIITPATPAISTSQQPATAPVGSSIADQATVTGGFNPTGTVTFNLYNNPNGTGTPLFTDTEPLVAGVATSASFTATVTGTDYWVATYNGDSNNNPVTSGLALEPVVITPATPAISTSQQPATIPVGGIVADQATVTGGFNPTGTVTFNLYDNPNGTGTPLFTDTETLVAGVATSASFTTTTTGTVFWVATYNGDSNNNAVTSAPAAEPVTITAATPAISTSQQPATATVGSAIADQATVTGGFNPTGTVTFNLYDNPNGTGTPLFTDTETLVAGVATSASFTTTVTGTDFWVATYNGDSNNNPVTSALSDEPTTITAATPAISTSQQPATIPVGGTVADQATVTGGFNPTGTVTFNLYDNPNGTGTPLFTDTETLVAGVATSASFTTTTTGTVFWVAMYNGDSNNNAVTSAPAAEPVTITAASPAISTTQQPATVTVGGSVADQATVTGGLNPTGTVTFNLYNNPNGTGTPLFTDTEPLAAGVATSASFTTTATGTVYWVATYNGDSNNSAVTSAPAAEPVTITAATPVISTTQQPATVTVGGTVADRATVTGGLNPTGTVTFRLYSSATVQNSTTLLFTDTESLANGVATSKAFTTVTAGTDYWVATYNGDSNNNVVTSAPAAEPVVITQSIPNLTVTKTSPFTSVWQGSQIYFIITVTNLGPSTVTSFSLIDTLPAGLVNPVFKPSKGTYNSVTHVWSGVSLAKGQSVTMTLYVQVSLTATGTLTNVVQVGNSVASYSLTVLALSKRFFI